MTFSVMMLKVCHYNSVEYENKTLPRRKLQFFSPFVLFFIMKLMNGPIQRRHEDWAHKKKGLTFCIFSRQKRRHCRHQPNCLTPACLPACYSLSLGCCLCACNAWWPGCILAPAIKVIARRYTHTSPAIGHAQTSFTKLHIQRPSLWDGLSVLKLTLCLLSFAAMGKKISKHQRLKQLLEIDLGRSLLLTAATSFAQS